MKQRLVLTALVLALAIPATAQNLQTLAINGTVTDESGLPLPDVSVRVDNPFQGTATDLEGRYSLDIVTTQSSVVVVFSSVGYVTQNVTVTQSGRYDVQLVADILGLSEVVITGTSGLTEKRQLGNSISVVSARELNEAGTVDPTAALAGKIPGAVISQTSGSPAGEISVKLRGNSTIFGNAEPLYVIDGVIVDNSSNEIVTVGSGGVQNRLVDINPNDIERIEVVKGAAAAAIYGSQASNGVVQIFTKQGSAGAPRVTYSTSLSSNSIRKTVKVNDAPFDWEVPTDNSNLNRVPVERFDYQDYLFRTGMGSSHDLSISGGQGGTTYYVSGSFLYNEGFVRNSDFNRGGIRARVNHVLSDWVRVNVSTSITRSFSNDVPTGGGGFFDGSITTIQFLPHTATAEPNELGEYPAPGNAFFGNPFEVVDRYEFTQDVNRNISSVAVSLTPYEGLSIDAVGGYDNYAQLARGFKPVGTVSTPTGFTSRGDYSKQLLSSDIRATYTRDVNADFTSNSSVGYTYQYERTEIIANSAGNLGPIVETIDGGTVSSSRDDIIEGAIRGFFAQQTVGYQDKAFVTLAGRVDGASRYSEDNRNNFYPKVSASYELSREDFLANSPFDFLKLRASWGKSGNVTGIGEYDRLTNYNPVPIGGETGLVPSTLVGNPDIKPETQSEIEVGFDATLLNNKLGLEFTFYNMNVNDLVLPRELSPSTGASTRLDNVGELRNRGIELLVRGTPVQQRDLNWSITGTFARNRNEVVSLNGSNFAIGGFSSQWAIEGEPLGVFYWRAYARDANGDILLTPGGLPQAERGDQALQDETGDGAQRDASGQPTGALLRVLVGDPNPDWSGSLINTVSYKKVDFRMQWDAVQGFDVMNWNRRNFDRHNYRGGYDYGQELKDGSTIPKGTANAKGSGLILEEYVEDASFIKLREISVGYTLDPQLRWIRNLNLRLSGRNLLSIDDYTGYDPEVTIQGRNTGIAGFDFGSVPIPRSYSISATINF